MFRVCFPYEERPRVHGEPGYIKNSNRFFEFI